MNLVKLIVGKLEGSLSPEEETLFEEWLNGSTENKAIFFRLNILKNKGVDFSELLRLHPEYAWELVKHRAIMEKRKTNYFGRMPFLKYAAVFLCSLGLGYGCWALMSRQKEVIEIPDDAITLQLDNGEVKILTSEGSDNTITDTKGQVLGVRKGTQLNYTQSAVQEELIYNTLTIPYGKRFNIVLSDGSNVHLNAGSSLKYPVKFLQGEKRKVFLEGEAFFDVSKDAQHPFIVSSENMNVRVLGTKFNVASYPEDPNINTVLVEGAVDLYGADVAYNEDVSTRLEPGFMATWGKTEEKVALKKVNTDIYTGWLDGKLVIKKMPFKDILKKLQRHYNVSITNDYKELNEKVFTATFDIESVEEVLDTFVEDTPFQYQIEGSNISIQKQSNILTH